MKKCIDSKAETDPIAKGLAASPGTASGKAVFSIEEAKRQAEKGEKVILVSAETSLEDIEGVLTLEGLLTIRGGMTSHAAVVARGMSKPCVCGCEEIKLDIENKGFIVQDKKFKEGEYITIDGESGEVILGSVERINSMLSQEVK